MPETFATLLAHHRRVRDLSQYDVARAADLSSSYISRLESGDRHPDRHTVMVLADALRLPPPHRVALYAVAGFTCPDPPLDPVVMALAVLFANPALDATRRQTALDVVTDVVVWLSDPTANAPTTQNNGPPRDEHPPSRPNTHDDDPMRARAREPTANLDITLPPLMVGGVESGEDSP